MRKLRPHGSPGVFHAGALRVISRDVGNMSLPRKTELKNSSAS